MILCDFPLARQACGAFQRPLPIWMFFGRQTVRTGKRNEIMQERGKMKLMGDKSGQRNFHKNYNYNKNHSNIVHLNYYHIIFVHAEPMVYRHGRTLISMQHTTKTYTLSVPV